MSARTLAPLMRPLLVVLRQLGIEIGLHLFQRPWISCRTLRNAQFSPDCLFTRKYVEYRNLDE